MCGHPESLTHKTQTLRCGRLDGYTRDIDSEDLGNRRPHTRYVGQQARLLRNHGRIDIRDYEARSSDPGTDILEEMAAIGPSPISPRAAAPSSASMIA